MESAKEQYEREYQSKVRKLQVRSEDQERAQKEMMQKLVRALLEREAKHGGGASGKTKASRGEDKKKGSYSAVFCWLSGTYPIALAKCRHFWNNFLQIRGTPTLFPVDSISLRIMIPPKSIKHIRVPRQNTTV